MLSSFIVKHHFNKLAVSTYVDCEKKEISVTVKYDRRIVRNDAPNANIRYDSRDMCSPEHIETFFRQPHANPELGNRLEGMEYSYRLDAIKAA